VVRLIYVFAPPKKGRRLAGNMSSGGWNRKPENKCLPAEQGLNRKLKNKYLPAEQGWNRNLKNKCLLAEQGVEQKP
jgi:hypothetical protein